MKKSVVLVVAALLALAGCSSSQTTAGQMPAPKPLGTAAGSAAQGELTIFAAASLKTGFDQLRERFLNTHPGTTINISYDGSASLATQLLGGAQADVFASADDATMTKVAEQLAGSPQQFAVNTLQIAVAPGNPRGVKALADLANPELTVVLCAAAVPCGAAARTAFAAAGVSVAQASEELNVTAVLTKVETGDADAGLVYRTDVLAAQGKVEGIDFAEAAKAVNRYPIAVLKGSANQPAAQAFVDLVLSPEGQKVLADLGFGRG